MNKIFSYHFNAKTKKFIIKISIVIKVIYLKEKLKKKQTLTLILIIGTQTDNYLSIQGQYQYKNLRRVNSDLLDYIFIPMSE
jgi:hypothetical protein